MDRRTFIETLTCGAAAALLPSFTLARRPLRFGVVTDCHFARKTATGNRYYEDSIKKMHDAVEEFNRAGLDFVIELGDLKDMREVNDNDNDNGNDNDNESRESLALGGRWGASPLSAPELALGFLDDIEREFRRFHGPCYHVLGNHDMDCITKEEFLSHTHNHGKSRGQAFYAFKKKGVKFIVLDANFNEDRTPYSRGNYQWWKAFVPQEQIDWLDRELGADEMPAVVFCHQMLDGFSDAPRNVCVGNGQEVVDVLEKHGNVLAVMQGHHHAGHHSQRAGIHYITFKAMIEGEYPVHNSYAIVEIDSRGNITIEGFGHQDSVGWRT